jgi:hypothetical protein
MDYHIRCVSDATRRPISPNIDNNYLNYYTITYVRPTFPDVPLSSLPHMVVRAGRPGDGIPDCVAMNVRFVPPRPAVCSRSLASRFGHLTRRPPRLLSAKTVATRLGVLTRRPRMGVPTGTGHSVARPGTTTCTG